MQTTGADEFAGWGKKAPPARMLQAKMLKLVTVFEWPWSGARSIPQEVDSTAADYPVQRPEPKEHPQPISATTGDDWPVVEPKADPTLE